MEDIHVDTESVPQSQFESVPRAAQLETNLSPYDFILRVLGPYSHWQRAYFLITAYTFGVWSLVTFSMVFMAPKTPFVCIEADSLNADLSTVTNETLSDKCQFTVNEETVRCTNWTYDHEVFKATLIEKWNLACHRDWFLTLSSSFTMGGALVATFISGFVADRYGRRPIIMLTGAAAIVVSFMSLMVKTTKTYVGFRFLLGCFKTTVVQYVLLSEIMDVPQREILCSSVWLGWILAYVFLPLIAFAIRDWFFIQFIISATFLPFVCLYFVVPESPRWMLYNKKAEEAEKELTRAIKMNRRGIKDAGAYVRYFLNTYSHWAKGPHNYSIFEIFRTSSLRYRSLILFFFWFTSGLVYYGIALNTDVMYPGDLFWSVFLLAMAEFPAFLISIGAVRFIRRRKVIIATKTLSGIACYFFVYVKKYKQGWWSWVPPTLLVLVKMFCGININIGYVYTSEVYPTAIRAMGVGLCVVWMDFASFLAPYLHVMEKYLSVTFTMTSFGTLTLISGVFCLFLPETKGLPTPDTIAEAEALRMFNPFARFRRTA